MTDRQTTDQPTDGHEGSWGFQNIARAVICSWKKNRTVWKVINATSKLNLWSSQSKNKSLYVIAKKTDFLELELRGLCHHLQQLQTKSRPPLKNKPRYYNAAPQKLQKLGILKNCIKFWIFWFYKMSKLWWCISNIDKYYMYLMN